MAFWDKVKGVANDAMNTLSDAACLLYTSDAADE